MNETLQKVVDSLPVIRLLYDRPVYLVVLDDKGEVLGYSVPAGDKPKLQIGENFQDPSGAYDEVIRTGRPKHNILPKEVMGEAFEGNLAPIKEGGRVIGCVICTYSLGQDKRYKKVAEKFQESVQEIDSSIQDVVEGMEKLNSMLTKMDEMTFGVERDVTGTADVVNRISSNASHSNILALNASIEAARSGEAGRGFAVVATEMGKLAKDSGTSAEEIKKTLQDIIKHLSVIITSIKDANEVAKNHMDSIHSIKSILAQTISLAQQLENDAKQ